MSSQMSLLSVPVALTIAGSDNSAGAGIQADLKTITALGVYGVTAITCVVAEVPGKVTAIQPLAPEMVVEQIGLSFGAFPVGAVKTGMLYSEEILTSVVVTLEQEFAKLSKRPFLVVDPVMVATSGEPLLKGDAVKGYIEKLIPLAGLVTPNLDEVQTLLGQKVASLDDMRAAATDLVKRFGTAFLIKGGHLRDQIATDLLLSPGKPLFQFQAPYVQEVSTHGTGCTYSAAITAGMANGLSLEEAVGQAKNFVTSAIKSFLRWKGPTSQIDALNHAFAQI